MRSSVMIGAMLIGAAMGHGVASAQAIDAGDYVPAPDGTQLGLLYLQYANAKGIYADGRNVDPDAELESAVAIARYVGFTKVGGMTLDYQVLQPVGYLRGHGSAAALGETTGFGDTILVSTLWLHEDAESGTYFGVTPYVFVPTGDYRADRPLNLGENRWKGSIQAVVSKKVAPKTILELSGDAMVFGVNDDLGAASQRLTQKPMYRVQGFARYLLDDKNELNARLMYVGGGEQRIDGIEQNNPIATTSILGTWRHTISPKWQLMTQLGTDLDVQNGFKEGARVQLRILRVF
ncbi:transporter [Sphingomonas sp. BGYR3]|uniref:transporter n=1 Tax=Sphingomonas sp. BGYR3 TaxID=2975483 RepID=UPI0021A5D5D3|nr:transporter [Sphingomonas sp. BGYR3]MDG5487795.1 transporter [Sphingomonas sp. BGYR3]